MEAISKEAFLMGWGKAKAFGKGELETQTNIKEVIRMIENGGMVSLLGSQETLTKENIKLTLEMDTAKCIGQTALVTKDIG